MSISPRNQEKKGALSLEEPLVAVVEVASEEDRAVVGVVFAAARFVEVIAVLVLTELVEDELVEEETSTTSVFVELALVLAELAALPPSPHSTTVSQPPAKVSSQ